MILLSFGFTFPIGLAILLILLIKIGIDWFMIYSKTSFHNSICLNTEFVN